MDKLDLGLQALSSVTIFSKYAKYLPELNRRETWDEIIDRYEVMLWRKYPSLKKEISHNVGYVRQKKVLPSMRALQFAGAALEVNNSRAFNCAYLPIDSLYSFSETMFLLLGGSGVGYSVQRHHISNLPPIKKSSKTRRYLIQDSIIGWADAIKALMKGYFGIASIPDFDYRDIRTKGTRLKTAGGKAPGPEPLKLCIAHIQAILDRKQDDDKLSSVECHDILCYIANSVLAGGIRRSAMICLFDIDDEEMITCKYGKWWELNEQRGRANNSAVLVRGKIGEQQFSELWKRIQLSGSGEPGIYWTNDRDWGTNPCCEIGLRAFQFCNLCEVNVSDVKDNEDLTDRVGVAAFFGTLQAGFTDFHYLRPIWERTTKKDALLGIGMTGIGSDAIDDCDLRSAAVIALRINEEIAQKIGINKAARLTCVKPSGTTSCVLGTSSGVHAWHAPYYLRTVRFNKDEEVAKYLLSNNPEICEDDILRPTEILCARFPIKAPENALFRTESPITTLKRVKEIAQSWIKVGHRDGANTHNVSATISIKDNQWDRVGDWMWENKDFYNGISVLPFDGGSYTQAPFEDITEEEYNKRIKNVRDIDLSQVMEVDDNVHFAMTSACAGGKCEVDL